MSESPSLVAVPGRPTAIRLAFTLAAVLLATLVAGGGATAATTAPTFSRADHPQLGSNLIAADFNGDGRPDLAGIGAQSAAVILASGNGTFGARVEHPVASWAQDLAAGDLNGDGRTDLVLTINDPQISLSLLAGNGDGTFAPAVNFANTSGFDSPAIVITDLNNDARLDLVFAHQIGCFTAPCVVARTLSVMMGNGDGTFQPSREIEVGTGMSRIAVGDFNRDGNKDLAIAGDSSRVYRLFGAGDGTFVQQPTLTLTADTFGVDATDIDVADFNGDTIQDLVVAIALNGSRTAILIGLGDGTFQQPLIITDQNLNVPQVQAVADYNGDGFQDLALGLANGNQGLMQILNGNGDGTFQAPRLYLVPPPQSSIGTVAIASANLNSDGRADLALGVGGAAPALVVLINTTGTAPAPIPAAPALLSPAQDARPAQPVVLDWTDVSAATSYRIQIDDSSNFSAPLVVDQTVTASRFTASTLGARQHWWRVRGINSDGVSGAWSSVRRFTPRAVAAAPALSAVAVSPASVTGGNPSTGTVTLTAAAPSGGFVVSLASGNAAASVPSSVSVAQGGTSATFPISTSAVANSTAVTITASAGGVTRSATLTVNPPGQAATLTVSVTGRGGERVTSSPAGINVPVGSSGSASFAVGTRITLSASNGRDAVWSGACSSGGNKARSCTFTFGGNATVSANVQ
jgi:hypothetical protein